ncbi:hypothetical protein M885DRAFT_576838 [Pelagophyceae sp. CCMP2097]|nr:hypothetical protein M885DRAFT_576838 [Pelagophyceae sp. CCMP2097]
MVRASLIAGENLTIRLVKARLRVQLKARAEKTWLKRLVGDASKATGGEDDADYGARTTDHRLNRGDTGNGGGTGGDSNGSSSSSSSYDDDLPPAPPKKKPRVAAPSNRRSNARQAPAPRRYAD